MGILDILYEYAGEPQAQADTPAHFDEVASLASHDMLGSGIASMFRSSFTPPFGSSVGSLFGQSNATQRAGVVNEIVRSLGPSALTAGGGVIGRLVGGSVPAAPGQVQAITPDQAAKLSPTDVSVLANQAQQQNPAVVDSVGSFYATHPALVKTLGAVALAVAMSHMRR